MKKESFDLIYPIINLISSTDKRFSFDTEWKFRKNEHVFGVTMNFTDGNLKLSDYTCVFFSIGDDYEATKEGSFGFDEMLKDVEEFIKKAELL